MGVMTVSNVNKKIKSNVQLELTGSQISLSPRPLPASHFACSSRYQSYPMRRAISAFGFQPDDHQRGMSTNCRPLSADNIRLANKKKFTVHFAENDDYAKVSDSSQDSQNNLLSENEFENIINGYSENKQICEPVTPTAAETVLKPGLSSKPPLPFSVEPKNTSKSLTEVANRGSPHAKTLAEEEAFDEIIALKFKRWFPDPIIRQPGDSSTDDDGDNLELLSYSEQKFQTCEYRYEVTKKNTKISTLDKTKARNTLLKNNNSKNKNKVSPRIKSKVFARRGRQSPPDKYPQELNVTEKERQSVDTICGGSLDGNSCNKINDNPEITFTDYEDSPDTAVNENNNSLRWLEEQDMRTLLEKQNAGKNVEKIDTIDNQRSINGNERKSNIVKTNANPYKKQKKISFLIDKQVNGDSSKCKGESRRGDELTRVAESVDSEISCDKNSADDAYQRAKKDTCVSSPPQSVDDVLSWMDVHRSTSSCSNLTDSKSDENHYMYKEIVDILKDIEQENQKEIPSESNVGDSTDQNSPASSSAKAIWSLLEEAEKNNRIDAEKQHPSSATPTPISQSKRSPVVEEPKNRNRLSDLLRHSSTDLAQKVMTLQLLLEEKEIALQNHISRLKKIESQHHEQKRELESSFSQQSRLIEQVKTEKKTAVEKLEMIIKDMEKKHALALQTQEDNYKVVLKKALEKQAAADRMEREKWIETRTQKIKEHALRGLQPEINRMTIAHQEEISEMRKLHKREREELEDRLKRHMAVQKETMEAEKEKALAVEREISRQKLNDEIGELERKYQDQRKRMLAEVHFEQEKMERANEATLAKREKELERKWEIKEIEAQKRIEAIQLQHQEEIQKIQQNLEAEKLIWIQKQSMDQKEKENQMKEQCKKERDRDIKLIVEKLENENRENELAFEQKVKRLKEQYDVELKDMETANEHLRRKLTESRNQLQSCEEVNSQLRTQLNQSNTEYAILKEKYDRLLNEQTKIQNMAKSEVSTQIHILQSQLKQAQLTFEAEKKSLESEKERELSRVYNKMKELFMEKDDLINSLKKQKDAALAQCSELEKFLDMKRRDSNFYG